MAALMVLSSALTSIAAPQMLLRLVEEEKVGCAATATSVTGVAASPSKNVPLRKRAAQYQAQHRLSFLRRAAHAPQVAIVPDCLRFKTRLLASQRSTYPQQHAPRLQMAENVPSSPRAPPFALPFL